MLKEKILPRPNHNFLVSLLAIVFFEFPTKRTLSLSWAQNRSPKHGIPCYNAWIRLEYFRR
jgi:hypothetical protein